MSELIGNIANFGTKYNPIDSYNKSIGDSLGKAGFDQANNNLNNFQNILNEEMSNVEAVNKPEKPMEIGISMTENINKMQFQDSIGAPYNSEMALSSSSPVESTANNFVNGLSKSINNLNNAQLNAESAVETLASGGDISVHDVMIATEKAGLNMQMALQVRNKMLAAYNELYQIRF